MLVASIAGNAVDPCTPANTVDITKQTWALVNYKYHGNEIWRFGLLLIIILLTLAVGRIVQFLITRSARRLQEKEGVNLFELFLKCLAKPASIAVFAVGVYVSRYSLRFITESNAEGFSSRSFEIWARMGHMLTTIAIAYFLYRLVDIIEYYLRRWAGRTETTLDDMLVPVVRKSLRIFIAIIAILFIADNILKQDLGTILAAAGVGGLAFALAAKDTLANFFGAINIFADRPFQVGERIKIGGYDGPVEDVGFRSTRIRTLNGHLVSIPNGKIVNEMIENIGRRPFIKRVANIGVTYDTPPEKVEKAVLIIKDILDNTEEVNRDIDLVPRVYFNEFADFYLNILVIYWVKPPDYWLFQEVNEKVNLAIMRAFEAENIEFAFPTQTLYLKNSN